MPKHAESILAEALELPPVERAELVESILSSFEFQSRKAIDMLWALEAEDRIDAYDRGEMAAIPAKDVFAEIENDGKWQWEKNSG
jgi:putative addiction module component (TIGR02574 family)